VVKLKIKLIWLIKMVKIKDNIVRWFIKNVVMPRQEIIDKPGFIVCQFTEKGKETYLRELIVSESLFAQIETEFIKKFGDKGRQALYSAGKKFGYRYALISNFPTIKETSEKDFENFIYMFMRYIETMWSSGISHSIDFKTKEYDVKLNDYIICRKNGIGHFMLEGCVSGYWEFCIDDETVEGIQIKCTGRGDDYCELICAPYKVLSEKRLNVIKEKSLENLELGKNYRTINAIRNTVYAKRSFQYLVNAGFFKHSGGVVIFGDERYFGCEASIIYLLEDEIKKLKNGENILFDVCFKFGKKLVEEQRDKVSKDFIMDYMSALGWGDILIKKKEGKNMAISNLFPWTKFSKDCNFVVYKGLLSGLLSGFLGNHILLKKVETHLSSEGFAVIVSEI